MNAADMMREAAGIYEERNKIYGDNYKKFGHVMYAILGNESFCSPDEYNRLGIFVQMVSKLTRYAENFDCGGHKDSLDDLAVYTMMLQELDAEIRSRSINKERGK